MAFENQNQLKIQHDEGYYNIGPTNTPKTGRLYNEWGGYQYTPLNTIVDQFIISYVGEDKVIPKVNKQDVQFHAARGLAEFTFDILRSQKGFEFTLPPSLGMQLPQDFVHYTGINWSDASGIKHPIYPTLDTSNPFKPFQTDKTDSKNQFSINTIGTTTVGSHYVELDGLYPDIMGNGVNSNKNAFVRYANPAVFDLPTAGLNPLTQATLNVRVVAAWHDKATQKTWVELRAGPVPTSIALNAYIATEVTLEFVNQDDFMSGAASGPNYNLPRGGREPIIVFDPVWTTNVTGGTNQNRILAPSPGDVANVKSGMRASARDTYFNTSNSLVVDVDYVNGYIYLEMDQGGGAGFFTDSTTIPPGSPFTAVPSITFHDQDYKDGTAGSENRGPFYDNESTTLSGFKSGSTTDSSDDDDEIWKLNGERYGLDPVRANANGTFYIDEQAGMMRFSSNLSGKTIVIDYISDNLGEKREMVVHKLAEEALYKWIVYAILSSKRNTPLALLARFKKERFAEMRKAKLRLSNYKPREFTQFLRGKSKQIKS